AVPALLGAASCSRRRLPLSWIRLLTATPPDYFEQEAGENRLMSDVETKTYPSEFLRDFTVRVFQHFGVPDEDAHLAAEVLATSDLRGIDSHGVARLHTYFDMLTLGRINPKPELKIVRETASTATVDGDNGLGLVVG